MIFACFIYKIQGRFYKHILSQILRKEITYFNEAERSIQPQVFADIIICYFYGNHNIYSVFTGKKCPDDNIGAYEKTEPAA